jgi:hypothetical protein
MLTMPRCLQLLAVTLAVTSFSNNSLATAPFQKRFEASYVKKSGDKEFQAAFKKSGCYTCHVKRKKKEVVNAYGWELSLLIKDNVKDRIDEAKKKGSEARKAEEEKVLKEFDEAMKKVETKRSPSKELYAEMFKAHRLPTAEGAKSVRKKYEGEDEAVDVDDDGEEDEEAKE